MKLWNFKTQTYDTVASITDTNAFNYMPQNPRRRKPLRNATGTRGATDPSVDANSLTTSGLELGVILRIFGWSNAQGGVHHYRIREPLRGLALEGHYTRSSPVAVADIFREYDVVLVRGLHNPKNSLLWRWAAETEQPALRVYDLDDDIWGWPPGTQEYEYWTDERRLNVEINIQCADLVTTTTPALAELLVELNPRIAVLPNTIPEKLIRLFPPKHDGFIVGWQGAKQHVKDLALIYNPVLRFMLRHPDVQFHLWGPGGILDFPDALAPRIATYPWTPSVWQHYTRLDMDIGLAPLDMGETFNHTKSDIRLREYAALGVPFIATDGDTYRSTGLAARGLLATSEREWEEALELLYANGNRRDWMREQGRLRARLWTTEGNAREWAAAYERAIYARTLRRNAAGNGSPAYSGKAVYAKLDGDRAIDTISAEIL